MQLERKCIMFVRDSTNIVQDSKNLQDQIMNVACSNQNLQEK